jgi:hypothetical protein
MNRPEAPRTRWSEFARFAYQKVRLSATAAGVAPPGLTNTASATMPRTMSTKTSTTGNTMLEPAVSLAGVSGPEAEGGIPSPDPLPIVVAGIAGAPEFGTSGVT